MKSKPDVNKIYRFQDAQMFGHILFLYFFFYEMSCHDVDFGTFGGQKTEEARYSDETRLNTLLLLFFSDTIDRVSYFIPTL